MGLHRRHKTLFFSYPYPLLQPPLKEDFFPCASDEDIAATKLVAIAQRGEKKDFFDLWFLLRKYNWTLCELFRFCRQKYGISSEKENLFLRSLVYFEDAEHQKVFLKEGESLGEQDWKEIKKFFQELVKNFCLGP